MVWKTVSVFLALTAVATSACSKKDEAKADAAPPPSAIASHSVDDDVPPPPARDGGSPNTPKTPKELLDAHREALADAAKEGRYADVCKGAPWVPASICLWVAARADGKGADRPDSELYRAFFTREHWKHSYGQIVEEAGAEGDYEVKVGGYQNHCILDTVDTKFSSKGRFDLWVQEQPQTREITLNSGSTANWVVLEEAPLAKALMDLAHSGVNVESTGRAKDAMKMIALLQPYAERKGEIPSVPGATADAGPANVPAALGNAGVASPNTASSTPKPSTGVSASSPAGSPPTQKAAGGQGGTRNCEDCHGTSTAELQTALSFRSKQSVRCYNNAVAQDPTLRGKVSIAVVVGANGEACSASVSNNELGSPAVAQCVAGFFRGQTYPVPGGGCVSVNVPIAFAP